MKACFCVGTTPEVDEPAAPSDAISGGGWTKVRHTPVGTKWGPFTDLLAGTQVLGNPEADD